MTKNEELTAVYLDDEGCKEYVIFQKHRTLLNMLQTMGAFDIRGGSVTIHFDKVGRISGVEKIEHFVPLTVGMAQV